MAQPVEIQNRLLARLPKATLKRFVAQLERIEIARDHMIYEARAPIKYVYFPTSGVLSALTVMPDGNCIEVGNVGSEGAAGVIAFLGKAWSPNRVIGQISGESWRISEKDLQKAAEAEPTLRTLLLRYHSAYLAQVSQSVACNGLHSIAQRCSRWLLMTHDRVGSDEFGLTHDFLSMMLGVRRPSVTQTLQTLKGEGLLDYSWGSIKVLDRKGLEAKCCECYRLAEEEYQRLLGDGESAH